MTFVIPAAAEEPTWTIVPPANGSASMTHTIDGVTLAYTRAPDQRDNLRIAVPDCGSGSWEMEESLNSVTAGRLRKAAAEDIENARFNCKVTERIEERLLAGIDEAFAQVKPVFPPHAAIIGGWRVADEGSQPGDDSERTVTLTKALATVTMTYRPSENGQGASTEIEFTPCKGFTFSSGFDFGNPPEDHLKIINEQVAENYADFAKDCKTRAEPQAALMQDFPEALKTVEQWLAAKPFVYPPEPPSSEQEQ